MSQQELGFPDYVSLERYPHEPIVKDMAIDLVTIAEQKSSRLPRRVRKAFHNNKDLIVKGAQWSTTIFVTGQFEYESDLQQPELFSEVHADALNERVLRGAQYVGAAIMHDVTRTMPFRYRYNPIVRIDDKRMSVADWAENVWAPNYTKRFVMAATMHDAREMQ